MTPARFIPKTIVPTDEQVAIQTATANTLVVEANAGAAKTTTLALRIAESWQRGVTPDQILALTFTEPAVAALKAALRKVGVPHPVVSRLRIETFERFSAAVLRVIEGGEVPQLLAAEELKPHVWEAVLRVEGNPHEKHRDELQFPTVGDNSAIEAFLAEMLHLKGTLQLELDSSEDGLSPDRAAELGRDYLQLQVFRQYENQVRRGGHPDRPAFRGPFDATYDLARLILAGETLQGLRAWPAGLKVLVVDEMHDLNRAMFTVLEALLLNHPGCFFCGAGDHDQVIHQITGAETRFMQDELSVRTRRRIHRLPLTASYRFGRQLALRAGRLARKPYASNCEHDTPVAVRHYGPGAPSCVDQLLEEAHRWKTLHRGRRMSEWAVLLRHDHQSIELENRLLAAGLPYVTRGFDSYLLRPEVLLVRGLLAVAADNFSSVESADTRKRIVEAFVFFCEVEIIDAERPEVPQRRLVQEAVQFAIESPRVLMQFFENQVMNNVTPRVRRRLAAALEVARSQGGPELLPRFLAALDLRALAASRLVETRRREEALGNIDALERLALGHRDVGDFFAFLNAAELRQQALKDSDSLVLGTIESAKGLEFDHVLIPWLERKVFPDPHEPAEDEANLFYVGITRARKQLTLLGHAEHPSPLLARLQ